MADFRRTRRPRNYLSRREQRRLMWLVALLALVVLAMSEARKAGNWAWFATPTGGGTTLPAPRETQPHIGDRPFPGVKPAYLESIRDNTPFRSEEHDAWFHLLEILDTTDEAELRRQSIGPVTYSQFTRQPEQYRGRLVDSRGTIRRTTLQRAPENQRGIEQYYLTVLQPADRPSDPMLVYCLELPEGFPQGMDVSAEVELTGFYFKQQFYEAQDAGRIAPALLARTVHWLRESSDAGQPPVGMADVVVIVAVALGASVLVVVYVHTRTRRARLTANAAPQFDALRGVERERE